MPMPLYTYRSRPLPRRRAMERAAREGTSLSALIQQWIEVYAYEEEEEGEG